MPGMPNPDQQVGAAGRDAEAWCAYVRNYEQKVLSVTRFETTRARLLKEVRGPWVVNLGCGPTGHMENALAAIRAFRVGAADVSREMVVEARARTASDRVSFLVADNRDLPWADSSIDTLITINSFIPERRVDADRMFQEATRVLRPGGRLIAVLPAFEMSLAAAREWGAKVVMDPETRRELDTNGWQCFYLEEDIHDVLRRLNFSTHRVEKLVLSRPEEVRHVEAVYAPLLKGLKAGVAAAYPLFEHLLIAER